MSEQTHSIWNPRFMRQIIDSVADGVFIVDTHGLVSFWNPSMEQISGYSAQEAIGKPCTLISCSVCTGEECESGVKDCRILENKDSETIEGSLKHKSGYSVAIIKKASAVTDENGTILGVVEAVTDISELKKATKRAEEAALRLGELENINHIIGKSHEIQRVFVSLKAAAASDATILIQGESGTGKELVASAIHYNSDRRNQPFITVNCSALSESLLESELFGHVKGAYTGAVKDRTGRFEEAEGGTIFLDEIGELSPFIQVKLLRVLQEREVERVGDSLKKKIDIRIITATHRDLLGMVVEGNFREDLYYRLKVFPINLPPLRSRKDDIPLLVSSFVDKMNQKTGKQIKELSPSTMKLLLDYHWPGNVRELENTIEHAFVLCNSPIIDTDDLPREIQTTEQALVNEYQQLSSNRLASLTAAPHSNTLPNQQSSQYRTITEPTAYRFESATSDVSGTPRTVLSKFLTNPAPHGHINRRKPKVDKEELLALLDECNWNKKEAGRRIGVSHTAIWKYMKRWEIPLKKPQTEK
jgi:two-component system, NtrC family, response regulator HydG